MPCCEAVTAAVTAATWATILALAIAELKAELIRAMCGYRLALSSVR